MVTHLKIGEFARLAQVSPKTLHHYDAIGLLRPAYIDRLHTLIRRWIDKQGLDVGEPVREYYLQPPRSPRNPVGVMEIQYPLGEVGRDEVAHTGAHVGVRTGREAGTHRCAR